MSDIFTESYALAIDAGDPLRRFRDQFRIPQHAGRDCIYLCGNSLGLQPLAARDEVNHELEQWAALAVEGHFKGATPWMQAHERVREGLAELTGAKPVEVVAMNSLTVNLHLMMASFYRPTSDRYAILIEDGAFPSDRHAVESQIRFHGLDPEQALIELAPDLTDGNFSINSIEQTLAEHGKRIALVLWPGVQYRTGQAFDLAQITALAKSHGCMVGFDLAHAIGNLPLALHQSQADFAVWCTYKYLNAGPGAIAGCFVHEKYARSNLPRLAGWWGHDPASRFLMSPEFTPTPGVDGWQLSNPPVLALAPLRASLALFQQAGMPALRKKSLQLTAYMRELIEQNLSEYIHIVTPKEDHQHGCQLSLRVRAGRADGRALFEHLIANGIISDWREPDVIRVAPTPLYNRHIDVLALVRAMQAWFDARK